MPRPRKDGKIKKRNVPYNDPHKQIKEMVHSAQKLEKDIGKLHNDVDQIMIKQFANHDKILEDEETHRKWDSYLTRLIMKDSSSCI